MTIYNKPDEVVFAEKAKRGEVLPPPYLKRGWGGSFDISAGIPPMEYFNFIHKRNDENLLYLLQRGLPEWSVTLEYPVNAIVQHNSRFYQCVAQHTNQTPATAKMFWQELPLTALSDPDGFRFIGQAESIEQLRTIEPTADQQRILLKSWHAGKNLGGGEFYADFADSTTADNGGTVIVTSSGNRWKRVSQRVTPFEFGAVGDGVADDTDAINRMITAGLPIDGLGLTLRCTVLPYGYEFKNCRFKVGELFYPTTDYLFADYAKITNGGIYLSHPQDAAYVLGNQIKCWIGASAAHLDSNVQAAVIVSEDGGTSYSAPTLLDITRKQNTVWSAGVAHGVEYAFERMTDVAPFSYRLHKRAVPSGATANYQGSFEVVELTFVMPSWSRDVQPVMIHSFAECEDGFVVGASFTEGAGLYKSSDGGASFQFIELKQGSNFEEPTVKYENGIFAGFIRGGNEGARPIFWVSRDNLQTIKTYNAPENVFLNSKLQDACIPLALKNGEVHGFTVARNGTVSGLADEYAPIYYIKGNLVDGDNLWENAEITVMGYAYHAELGGASACGQGSVVVYRNKLIFMYGSEERTGSHRSGNRIANIHSITLPLEKPLTPISFDAQVEQNRATEGYGLMDGSRLLPHGKTILRRERVVTQKLHHVPSIASDFIIAGKGSSAGVSVLTDGPYSNFLTLDHQNKIAGVRIDNTTGAIQILSQDNEVIRYNPKNSAFHPARTGEVDLGASGKAFRKLYVNQGEINTAATTAEGTEIVNAKWVRRFIANSVIRKNYQTTIYGTAEGHTDKAISVTGSVTAYADGRIVQTFHIRDIRFIWFVNEDSALVNSENGSTSYGREITLNLWTAMPNSITDVRPIPVRAVNKQNSRHYAGEAAEIRAAWSLFEQNEVRSRVVVNLAQSVGSVNETFDLFVTVEGY